LLHVGAASVGQAVGVPMGYLPLAALPAMHLGGPQGEAARLTVHRERDVLKASGIGHVTRHVIRLQFEVVGRAVCQRSRILLAEPHVAALSVSAGQGRGPFTVPIWYQYTPGEEAWVLTEAGSRKARLIETAGRFSLMVDRVMPTVRYVSVEGPVTRIVPGTDELLQEITARYLPPDRCRPPRGFAW
jgi:hypothetical protein